MCNAAVNIKVRVSNCLALPTTLPCFSPGKKNVVNCAYPSLASRLPTKSLAPRRNTECTRAIVRTLCAHVIRFQSRVRYSIYGLPHGEKAIDRERTEMRLFLPALRTTRAKHYAPAQFVSPWASTHAGHAR